MADDNTSSWMDFAQRSRDDGGLGLAPHQAAGLVGNLQNESGSGITPWGVSGDNGTAQGSAQWREDRLDGLKRNSQANGLDYRTPEAQQAWMRQEFDTTHNGAYKALQASTTPEEAANVVNRQYEISADRSGHREQSARRLYDGTDGPTAIDAAMGRTRSTGSKAMAFAGTDDETAPALSTAATLGPGALGANPAAANPKLAWLDTLGQTLMNMAPGIAQDPATRQALASSAAAQQKTATQGSWSTNFDPRTGVATQTNSATGGTRQFKYAAPKPDEKWGVISHDAYGKPVEGYIPSKEDWDKSQADKASQPAPPDISGLTGQPLLDALTQNPAKGPKYVGRVKAIAEGREDLPVGRAAMEGTPGGDLVNDVLAYDDKFEKGNGLARSQLRKDYETSTSPNSAAVQIRMGDTSMEHVGQLSDTLEKLKSFGEHEGTKFLSPLQNKLHYAAIRGTGTPEAQALQAYENEVERFATENSKYVGGGSAPAEGTKQIVRDLYDPSKALPELRAQLNSEVGLNYGKGEALQNAWRKGNNYSDKVPDFEVLSKKSLENGARVKERYERTANGGYVPANPDATPTAAPSGAKPITSGSYKAPTGASIPWSLN